MHYGQVAGHIYSVLGARTGQAKSERAVKACTKLVNAMILILFVLIGDNEA